MRFVWFSIICMFLLQEINAQSYVKKGIGISVNSAEGAFSIQKTSKDTYLLSGNSMYYLNNNLVISSLLFHVDEQGFTIDSLLYNRSTTGLDSFFDAVEFENFIWILGRYNVPGTIDYDTYIIKADNRLNPLVIYEFDLGYAEEIRYIFIDSLDKTILLLGYHYHDSSQDSSQIVLAKMDTSGNLLWKKEYGGPGYDFAYHLLLLPDSGYMLTGEMTAAPFPNNANRNLFIMKLDSSFNEIWTKYYGTPDNDRAGFSNNSVVTADTSIIMVGFKYIPNPSEALTVAYALKTDINGYLIWEKYYGIPTSYQIFHTIHTATDGDYFISGSRVGDNGGLDAWLVKINDSGDLLWERTYDFNAAFYDAKWIWDATLNSYGGFAMTGFVIYQGPQSNDIIFITTDSCGYTDGDVASAELFYEGLSAITYRFTNNGFQYCSTHWDFGDGATSDLPQYTHTYTSPGAYTVTLTARAGNAVETKTVVVNIPDVFNSVEITEQAAFHLYPNPASTQLMLTGSLPLSAKGAVFEIFNTAGKTVLSTYLPAGENNRSINISHLPEGLYGYRIISEHRMWQSGRVAVVR